MIMIMVYQSSFIAPYFPHDNLHAENVRPKAGDTSQRLAKQYRYH